MAMVSIRSASLLAAFLVAFVARAECENQGLSLFPAPGGVLPTNAKFILEGIGEQQAQVTALVGKRFVLKADDDEVLLRIQRAWQSPRGRVAVRLVPSRPLKPNRAYTLDIARLLPNAKLLNPASSTGEATWQTGKDADNTPPQWEQPPVPEEGEYERHGDDVTRWITLRTALSDESPAYVVVTLKKRHGNEVQTYFAPVNGERARLGHDTCSGNFALENRATYHATIEGYDSAGNSANPVPPVEVSSPVPVRP